MAPLSVRVAPLEDPEALGRSWEALARDAAPTAFTSWPWIASWLHELAVRPWLVEARRGRETVGLALVCCRRHWRHGLLPVRTAHLHATGDPRRDAITIEYNDLLVRPDEGEAVRQAMLARILAGPRADLLVDELWLSGFAGRSAPDPGLPAIRRLYARRPSARIELARLRGPYVEGLRSGVRRRLRRAIRLYRTRGPLVLERARAGSEALMWFDQLAARHVAKWQARGRESAFAWPHFLRFHRRLLATAPHVARLCRLRAGAEVVGILYLLCWRDHAFFYAGGFAFERDNRLKPGLVTHAFAVEHLREEGFAVYDLGGGAEPYKLELGTPGPELVTWVLARPSLLLRGEHALRQLRARWRHRTSAAADVASAG